MTEQDKKVMVFGVFDGLHEGHLFFLNEAQKRAQTLIIVVTPDEAVLKQKGRLPSRSLSERIESLKEAYPEALVIQGDTTMGQWTPIVEQKPDIIVCGYDQQALRKALEEIAPIYGIQIEGITESHKEDEFHSSLLRGKE